MTRLAVLLFFFALVSSPFAHAQTRGPVEGTSLLGRTLYALPEQDRAIESAQQALRADSSNAALAVRLSKAQAARRLYREAIVTCTNALLTSPSNAELYLERGHRELGLRDFQTALADLSHSVDLDPKQLDAHYHQGLAYYFLGKYDQAAASFAAALALAQSSDSVIDCSNWLYVSRRRAGQTSEAAQVLRRITPDMKNTEPHLYAYLRLLRFYQGKLSENELAPPHPNGPDDIEGELLFNTVSYGIGNWRLYNNRDASGAEQLFRQVASGSAWNSWGFIGSELELSRTKR